MSDSRIIPLDELNKIIDNKVKEYKSSAEEYFQEIGDEEMGNQRLAQAQALQGLKLEIAIEMDEPKPIVNVSENVQQTTNVITTQNIVNDEL